MELHLATGEGRGGGAHIHIFVFCITDLFSRSVYKTEADSVLTTSDSVTSSTNFQWFAISGDLTARSLIMPARQSSQSEQLGAGH